MRHGRAGRKLNRSSGQRQALFRSLAVELLDHEVIHTTRRRPRASGRKPRRLISLAKRGAFWATGYTLNACYGSPQQRGRGQEIVQTRSRALRQPLVACPHHPPGPPQGRRRGDGSDRAGRGVERGSEWSVERGAWRGEAREGKQVRAVVEYDGTDYYGFRSNLASHDPR